MNAANTDLFPGNSANCYYAFHTPTDYWAQTQCETDNVNLNIEFCGDATQSGSSTPPPPPPPSGTHQIHPNGNKSKCLDVKGGVIANGTPVQMSVLFSFTFDYKAGY